MSSLRHIERIKFERLLDMGGGYVLDFSDRTFRDFVLENTNIDVYAPGYEEGGTSKANRLRMFWKKESDLVTAKLTEELLEYWRTQKLISSKGLEANEKTLYQECLQVVLRLKGQNTPTEHKPLQTQRSHPGVFISAKEIKNDGLIKGPRVDVFTEHYSGKEEISSPTPSHPISISHSYVHFGKGNNVGFNKNVQETPNDIPLWLKWLVAVVGILVFLWGVYIYFFPNPSFPEIDVTHSQETSSGIATSTISLSDILSKALTLETVVERQDFLKKYIGSIVSAEGVVSEVSRSGSGFLVDIKVNGQTITCPQESSDENEKLLLLLKGKRVEFMGKFPFSEIWGHGLGIDECILSKL